MIQAAGNRQQGCKRVCVNIMFRNLNQTGRGHWPGRLPRSRSRSSKGGRVRLRCFYFGRGKTGSAAREGVEESGRRWWLCSVLVREVMMAGVAGFREVRPVGREVMMGRCSSSGFKFVVVFNAATAWEPQKSAAGPVTLACWYFDSTRLLVLHTLCHVLLLGQPRNLTHHCHCLWPHNPESRLSSTLPNSHTWQLFSIISDVHLLFPLIRQSHLNPSPSSVMAATTGATSTLSRPNMSQHW